MGKSLKDQAFAAAEAANVAPEVVVDNPPKDNQEDSKVEPVVTEPVKEEVPPVIDNTKPEEKVESKPSALEVDGETITVDDVRKWREDSINKERWQTDLTQKSQEISSVKTTLDQIKDIFVKENKSQELTPEEENFRKEADTLFKDPYVQNLIQSEINKGIELKTQEQLEKQKEDEKKKFQESLTNEVKNLEKEFNGSDGRPKYDDKEILAWQKENKKLYLSPKEAYEFKYKNELMEWEVQKRLKNQGGSAPKSSSTSASPERNVEGEKSALPNDKFIRGKAMLEHLQNLTKEA